MNVLVTGGTGYIGAHLVRLLADRSDFVLVADDVATGNSGRIGDAPLIQLNLASHSAVDEISRAMDEHSIETVVHFAARKQVAESVARPSWYYQQNVGGLVNLHLAMERSGVERFLFSSSAAVYAPSEAPVTEDDPTSPISPYGETKLIGEWLTKSETVSRTMCAASLRYFNVAGAGTPELGDRTAVNLIPMVIEKLVAGNAPVIFGDDYPTRDGTCIRDYIHVQDVAEAHLAVIDGFSSLGPGHHIFNVGTGRGHSVRDIINAILAEAGSGLSSVVAHRRPGDAPVVVAAVDRIRDTLGWSARFNLNEIVRSAWEAYQYGPSTL